MNETTREINIEPNYKALFRNFLSEFKTQAQPRAMFGEFLVPGQELAALRAVQRFFAPLAICANSATMIPEIEELRAVLADLSSELCRWINELDAQVQADPEESQL